MSRKSVSGFAIKDMLNISKWSEFFPKCHAVFGEHALHGMMRIKAAQKAAFFISAFNAIGLIS